MLELESAQRAFDDYLSTGDLVALPTTNFEYHFAGGCIATTFILDILIIGDPGILRNDRGHCDREWRLYK